MTETGFGEKVKGFLISPVETFQKIKDEDIDPLIKYFVILMLIFSIPMATIITINLTSPVLTPPLPMIFELPAKLLFKAGGLAAMVALAILMIALFGGLFIGAAIVHIFVYLLGGGKGYTQTVKSIGYGMTPLLLLGWIPFIGIIFSIWALVVGIIGIRELQDISTGKAVLALILPITMGIIVGIVMLAYTI